MEESRKLVQSRFGEFAQNYVDSNVHGNSYSLDRLLDLLHPEAGQSALDIATGGGHVALGLARRGAKVIASDLTPAMLTAARTNIQKEGFEIDYCQVEGGAIPFADGTFNRVTCRIAPHHFPDVGLFVRECARVVRPGGLVGIVDQVGPANPDAAKYVNAFEKLRDPSHVWEYRQDDWDIFFMDAGLTIQHRELARNRLNFDWWTKMQNNDADTVLRLRVMLKQAPKAVVEWLEPTMNDTNDDGFSLWQYIIVGSK